MSRAETVRRLNAGGSEFPYYAEPSLTVDHSSDQYAVNLPHPNHRSEKEWMYENPEYDEGEPKVRFLVTKTGFKFFTSTSVGPHHPMNGRIRGHLEEDYEEGDLRFYGETNNRLYSYDHPQIYLKF